MVSVGRPISKMMGLSQAKGKQQPLYGVHGVGHGGSHQDMAVPSRPGAHK